MAKKCNECGLKGVVKSCKILGCPQTPEPKSGEVKGCAWNFKEFKDHRRSRVKALTNIPDEVDPPVSNIVDAADWEGEGGNLPF